MTSLLLGALVLGVLLAVVAWVTLERNFRAAEPTTPLALCMDNSGSMSGPGQKWRDAFLYWALAKCEVRKRTVTVYFFEHDVPYVMTFPEGRGVSQMEIPRLGGGTHFEPVLTMALAQVGPGGHIVMLTDGIASLKPWLEDFNEARKSMGVDVRSIFLGDALNDPDEWVERWIKPFSDSVTVVSTAMSPDVLADFALDSGRST